MPCFSLQPESELYSSTTEEYSSEVKECEEEVTTPEISANQQQELNKLRLHVEELGKKLEEKQSTVQQLTNELQAMKARLPQEQVRSEGLSEKKKIFMKDEFAQEQSVTFGISVNFLMMQQLMLPQLQIESAIKERDDVITRLTSSLQTARQSRDQLQDDAQLFTSQIHTLQLQLQQASETLRRSAHGNAVADLLQAQQQIIVYQETINEQGFHLRDLQDEVKQHQEQLLLLQQQLVQAAVVSRAKVQLNMDYR
uniref:Uncharacterized protein n=1 Tax=Eptatretus burgeri TaxID=7764 RepID=A0A8C4QFZ2_EPTBU